MDTDFAIRSSGYWEPLGIRNPRPRDAPIAPHSNSASYKADSVPSDLSSGADRGAHIGRLPGTPTLPAMRKLLPSGGSGIFPKTIHGSTHEKTLTDVLHSDFESPNAHTRVRTLIEILAFGRAINLLSERSRDLAPACFSKVIDSQRTPARAEMAPLALSILRSHELATISKDELKASVVLSTPSENHDTRTVNPAQAEVTKNSLVSMEIRPTLDGTAPLSSTTCASNNLMSKKSKARRFSPVLIIIGSTIACAGVGTAVVLATNNSDQRNLEMLRRSVQQKRLRTINEDYIFGRNNGGLLIPE